MLCITQDNIYSMKAETFGQINKISPTDWEPNAITCVGIGIYFCWRSQMELICSIRPQ
jgi:hypothetical protein